VAQRIDLTCKELVELVTEYFENSLSPIDRERFESHLSGCNGCRNYLKQMKRTIDLVGRISEDAIPEESKITLLQTFRDWKQGHKDS
jgi:predicted anti-sigma-YlaC factor YlaD